MKPVEKRKRFDPRNYSMGKGQFFDQTTYCGNAWLALLGFLLFIIGWNLDEIGPWIWQQFGEELVVQAGKMKRDSMALIIIGSILILSAVFNWVRVFRSRIDR